MAPDMNLARFAAYYGFDPDRLADSKGYWIENAPADFDGHVHAIRVVKYGRSGNIFYQTLHAVALARHLGCATIFLLPFTGGADQPPTELDGIRIVFYAESDVGTMRMPTLGGHFFDSRSFGSVLRGLTPACAWTIIRACLKPLFQPVLDRTSPIGGHTLVMSFRSGDIFSGHTIHPFYVQPPASYYMKAMAFARAALGVTSARLVFEDDGNPTIAAVRAWLDAQGIPYAIQSGTLIEDLACLANARHLVVPYSTFGEIAAMLSDRIATYVAFRSFESHQHIHMRQQPLLLGVLRLKAVRTVLIEDAAGDYIPPRTWDRSAAQLRMMCDYRMEDLVVHEDDAAAERECAEAVAAAPAQVIAAEQEIARVQHLLIAARAETRAAEDRAQALRHDLDRISAMLDASRRETEAALDRLARTQASCDDLERAFRQSTSWRVTAPLRGLSRALHRRSAGPAG